MGFSNEYLTDEEKKMIARTEHFRLTSKSQDGFECLKNSCTVDRERKIWLLTYAFDYDWDKKTDGKPFILFYGNLSKSCMIELFLWDLGEERDAEIRRRYDVEVLQYWAIKDILIPKQLDIDKTIIQSILEELMTAYGISGNPKHKGPGFDRKIKAIIKEYNV